MLRLVPGKWKLYLERIGHRYAGQLMILRQREAGEREMGLVLWRTPLRGLRVDVDARGAQSEVYVDAGAVESTIEIPLGPVRDVSLRFTLDRDLEAIHFVGADGTESLLLFPQVDEG